MMKILVLDDSEERLKQFRENLIGYDFITVKTSREAISEISKNDFDLIFLDHDLGDQVFQTSGPGTGYEVAEFLQKNKTKAKIIIHSFNTVGAKNMKNLLPQAILMPGAWVSLKRILNE